MFENRRIARATIDAFTAQPSANRKAKRMRSIARTLLGCMAMLTLLLCAARAGVPAPVAVTVNTTPAGLPFTVDGTAYTTQQVFNWNPGDVHTLVTTTPQPVTSGGQAVAGEEYVLTQWNTVVEGVTTSTINNPFTFTVPSSPATLTAAFITEYAVTFESPNLAEGTVSVSTGPGLNSATSPVYLRPGYSALIIASPTGDYSTSNWQVNGSALSPAQANNDYMVTMSSSAPAPMDVQPVFTQLPTFVVNTNQDDDATFNLTTSPGNCTQQASLTKNTTDKACTLRDAVAAANIIEGMAAIGFDSTVFKAGNTAVQNTIFLTGDDLEPSTQMNIVGPGANILTVDGSNDPNIDDIFYIGNSPAPVTISGMTIAHGVAPEGGGAIWVDYQDEPGDLTVTNVVFDSNVATYNPVCVSCTSVPSRHQSSRARANAKSRTTAIAHPLVPAEESGSSGGAIGNVGFLTVIGCTFSNNSAFSGQDQTITDTGGAIFNIGEMEVIESTFYNNSSDIGGAIDDEADIGSFGGPLARPISRLTRSAAKPNFEVLMMGNLIQDNTFANNTSTRLNSGAISLLDNELEIYTSVFAGNTGAIYDGESPTEVLAVHGSKVEGRFTRRPKADTAVGPPEGLDVEFNIFYNNLGNESTPLEDDCTGGCSMDPDMNLTGYDTMLLPLGNYGGTTPTMLPQPGSSTICMLSTGFEPINPTDQRGYPRVNTSYSAGPCQDIGSVQTNYALAFSTEPPASVLTNLAITPAPAVTLTESDNATIAGGTVGVTGSTVALGGTLSSSLVKGTAAFADITLASATTGETITAALPMNLEWTPPFYITAVSSPFNVVAKSQPSVVASVSSPTSYIEGAVTLTATVSSTVGVGTPTGTVTFFDGTASLGTGTLTNGVATLLLSTLTAGSHSFTVSYAGDDSFLSGTSAAVTELVNLMPPSIVASVNTSTSFLQNTITLTATVSSSIGVGTPTGTVTFYDGTTALGTGTLSSGVATLNISTLTAGSRSITVTYAGDANFLSGTSAPVTEFVEDFTVNLVSTSATATVTPGSTLTFTFNVAPPSGATFPANITLSLSGLPAGATYSFSPSTLQAGAGATNVTLTVTLPPGLLASTSTGNLASRLAPFSLALLLLPFAGRLRKSRQAAWQHAADSLLLAARAWRPWPE